MLYKTQIKLNISEVNALKTIFIANLMPFCIFPQIQTLKCSLIQLEKH